MSRILRRLIPSPAMVVALTALVMSLGGSAYALVITGKSIKNNSVTGKDIRNRSLTGSDVKRDRLGGGSIRESSLGAVPSAVNALNAGTAGGLGTWAVVNNDGIAVRGRGLAAGDPAGRTSTGIYQVIFNRDVRNCAYEATQGTSGTTPPTLPSQISVSAHPANPNGVRIRTADAAGSVANRAFHLVVVC